jgi:hypothetical protein
MFSCPPACPVLRRPTSLRADEGALALLAEHRAGVVPLLIRLLFPKMRKRSGRLGGKGGLRTQRSWVCSQGGCLQLLCSRARSCHYFPAVCVLPGLSPAHPS